MLVLHRVRATAANGVTRFHNLNFLVRTGETICIVGKRQSGKTHLLKLIMGLQPPSAGQVWFKRLDWGRLRVQRRAELRQSMGLITTGMGLSAGHAVAKRETIAQFLALPLFIRGLEQPVIRERITKLLSDLEMPDMWNRYMDSLSLSEQCRLSIGRAFIHGPDIVLADVPLSVFKEEEGQFFEWVSRLRAPHTAFVCTEMAAMRYVDRNFDLAGEQWIE